MTINNMIKIKNGFQSQKQSKKPKSNKISKLKPNYQVPGQPVCEPQLVISLLDFSRPPPFNFENFRLG